MSDPAYQTWPAILQSKGIWARSSDDTVPAGAWLNMDNVEELEENTMISRLGSTIINKTGTTVNPLGGPVHSLSRLVNATSNSTWRYAGAGTGLYRRSGDAPGAYTVIASGLSGAQWSANPYRPTLSSYPYLFIADSAQMLKDNGTVTQQQGIFQPNTPVQALALNPQLIVLDTFENSTGSYSIVNASGAATTTRVSTTLTAAIGTTGVQKAVPASMTNIVPFQLLVIDRGGPQQETVLVLDIPYDNSGFFADFTKTHTIGATVTENYLSASVAASTTATVSKTGAFNLSTFPNGTLSQGADYIGMYLNIGAPENIEQIRILLDVGDGSFTEDYFYKLVVPSIYQDSITQTQDANTLITQIIYDQAIGVYTSGAASGYQLVSGENQWTKVLVQMSDFQTVGNAGLNSPGFTMASINAFRIEVVTNVNGGSTIGLDGLIAFGGYGPDSFAGVAYDWLYTYYNADTGLESNPCMFMSNPMPPQFTYQVIPRRQPVQLSLVPSTDAQVTNIRVYRRGGTLASNFFRVDQIAPNSTTYIDQSSDAEIEAADTISFTNDVPVTSTLPVPVIQTLQVPLNPTGTGELLFVNVTSNTNITPHQQVTIGADNDPYQEIVIVESVIAFDSFTAFVQNAHAVGAPVTAEAAYGQPCNIAAVAYNRQWLAGDPNNPHYLYYSNTFSPESFSAAGNIEVGTPDDPIIAIVPFLGSLYVGTRSTWYGISPSQQEGQQPTVYPTTAVHGISGSHGWVTTENEIWHQAVDGIRAFAGGSAVYKSQNIEFLFQPYVPGETPIEQANPSLLNQSVFAYWNNIVFLAYTGLDGNRYRLAYHTQYQRVRNDSVPAVSMFLERDTNTLLYGDTNGVIHQDRVGTFDEENVGGVVTDTPIALDLQTPYLDQGSPAAQKNYQNLTVDTNTNGETITATLLYNDGEQTEVVGTFSTANRQKVNLNLNSGLGEQGYRVSLQLTGDTLSQVIFYQVAIRGTVLAETRQSFDTYWSTFGTDASKLMKDGYFDYNATAPLSGQIFYDQNEVPEFTFTLPASVPRIVTRVRFPAVKFRLARLVITSTADFQLWPGSFLRAKAILTAIGYNQIPLATS